MKEFIKLSIENRKAFLSKHKEGFEAARTDKKRAEIIVFLLNIEPSHLDEPWIRDEVIRWMRNFDYADYLERAFIGRRNIKKLNQDMESDEQKEQRAIDAFVFRAVEEIIAEEKIAKTTAFRRLAWSDRGAKLRGPGKEKTGEEPETWFRDAYYRHYRNRKRTPVWPYFARDVVFNGETYTISGTGYFTIQDERVEIHPC